jgi:hypothetical protein
MQLDLPEDREVGRDAEHDTAQRYWSFDLEPRRFGRALTKQC